MGEATTSFPRLDNVWNATFIMLAQAPIVHPLNRMSIVGSESGYSAAKAVREIVMGSIDKSPPSIQNLQKGFGWHLFKEGARIFGKSYGALLLTELNDKFPSSPAKASAIFAAAMAAYEMVINPADVARVFLQGGGSPSALWGKLRNDAYAGALGNGYRQFGTYGIYSYSGVHLDKFFTKNTSLDVTSFDGRAVKSVIQSALITAGVYPFFERLNNEILRDKNICAGERFRYLAICKEVMKTKGGVMALTHGMFAKMLSNSILVYGFNLSVDEGKRHREFKPIQIGTGFFENSLVRISKVTVRPGEKPEMHNNEYDRVVFPLQSGSLTKVNDQGEVVGERVFTRGIPFKSSKTDKSNPHGNINFGKESISFLVVELKK